MEVKVGHPSAGDPRKILCEELFAQLQARAEGLGATKPPIPGFKVPFDEIPDQQAGEQFKAAVEAVLDCLNKSFAGGQ